MPFLVIRVDTLPKNAPIELEMIAMATKSAYQVQNALVNQGTGLFEVLDNQNNLAYQCDKSNTIESFLNNTNVSVASRVDIYLLSTETLDADIKGRI